LEGIPLYQFTSNLFVLLACGLVVSGCVSTQPRPYTAVLAVPAADNNAYGTAFWTCSQRVSAGETNFGPSKSANLVGEVATAVAVQSLSEAAVVSAIGGAVDLGSAGIGLMVAIPFATYRMSSEKRKQNEANVQKARTACLASEGYLVARWNIVPAKDLPSIALATPTQTIK
jgi:hypothetical protein